MPDKAEEGPEQVLPLKLGEIEKGTIIPNSCSNFNKLSAFDNSTTLLLVIHQERDKEITLH